MSSWGEVETHSSQNDGRTSDWDNAPVDHSMNVSRESVGGEFMRLILGLLLAVVFVALLLYFAGSELARLTPASWENRLDGKALTEMVIPDEEATGQQKAQHAQVQAYLERLGAQVARHVPPPKGLALKVHFVNSEVPNAFATLGGHLMVTRGLYERLPSENALIMVMGHEMGHLQRRDPIAAAAGHTLSAVLLTLMTGDAATVSNTIAQVVNLGYSRQAERRADEAGLAALRGIYGHVRGGADVFKVLQQAQQDMQKDLPVGLDKKDLPDFLSTHPSDEERIARLEKLEQAEAKQALKPLEVVLTAPTPQ